MSTSPENLEVVRWDITESDRHPAVAKVVDEYNRSDHERFSRYVRGQIAAHSGLQRVDEKTGIERLLIQMPGDSSTDAVLMFDPFGNRITMPQLLRADFVKKVLTQAGVTDEAGNALPVLMVGSPAGRSGLMSTHAQRRQISHGDPAPFVRSALDMARQRGLTRLRTLGHSMGGMFALAAPRAGHGMNVDVVAVGTSDAVVSKPYSSLIKFGQDFAADAEQLRVEVRQAGVQPYIIEQHMSEATGPLAQAFWDGLTVARMVRRPLVNLALAKCMAGAPLLPMLHDSMANCERITMGHGTADHLVANFDVVKHTAETAARHNPRSHLTLVEVVGGRHTWGDNLPAVGDFALRAFAETA